MRKTGFFYAHVADRSLISPLNPVRDQFFSEKDFYIERPMLLKIMAFNGRSGNFLMLAIHFESICT
jgi:hypothetical protein